MKSMKSQRFGRFLVIVFVILPIPAPVWSDCSDMLPRLQDEPSGLIACPCTLAQASSDSRFAESNHEISKYHPGAESCYRSTSTSVSGSGQQCCYDEDDVIMVGPPGGGTADRFSPMDWWLVLDHWLYDVQPWDECCSGDANSSDCQTYYDYRPSHDCTGYAP